MNFKQNNGLFVADRKLALPTNPELDRIINEQGKVLARETAVFVTECFSMVAPPELVDILNLWGVNPKLAADCIQLINQMGFQISQQSNGPEAITRVYRRVDGQFRILLGEITFLMEGGKITIRKAKNKEAKNYAYTTWTPIIRRWLRTHRTADNGRFTSIIDELLARPIEVKDGEEAGDNDGPRVEAAAQNSSDRVGTPADSSGGRGEGAGPVPVSPTGVEARHADPGTAPAADRVV